MPMEYGALPPAPHSCRAEEWHTATLREPDGIRLTNWKVCCGPDKPFAFMMTTLTPPGKGPFPVVLTGDACWRYANDRVVGSILRRGFVLAQFNRVEIVPDNYSSERRAGLYLVYPEGDYGALSAWAWAYHRCVDVLRDMPFVDAGKIAITGHSRGGKTVLLAGATDERIALVAANNSGAGGAGSFLRQGPDSETLADCLRVFSYWFAPSLRRYLGREHELPFDQHFLKALIAPRPLLTSEALGDTWANPSGTWQTHLAAQEVYRLLGAESRLGITFREGGHNHGPDDWAAFLDFMERQLLGKDVPRSFHPVSAPFPA